MWRCGQARGPSPLSPEATEARASWVLTPTLVQGLESSLLPGPLRGSLGTVAPTVDAPPKRKKPLLLLGPAGVADGAGGEEAGCPRRREGQSLTPLQDLGREAVTPRPLGITLTLTTASHHYPTPRSANLPDGQQGRAVWTPASKP